MRLLALLIGMPVVGLLSWWGIWAFGSPGEQTVRTYTVQRRTFDVTLQEKGELKAADSIDVKAEVEGRATIIWLIPEGSHVSKGDLLVELASDELEDRIQSQKIEVANAEARLESARQQFEILLDQNKSEIRQGELKLRLAQLELQKYEQGMWPQQLGDAEFRVEEAQKVLERREADLESAKQLVERNFITRTEYEQDEFDFYKAQVELEKAKRDLEILKEFTRVKDKQQKESDVEEATKELDRISKETAAKENEKKALLEASQSELELKRQRLNKLEQQMVKTRIVAPADGLVVYGDGNERWWGNDNEIKEGATVHERQTLLQLPDTSQMKVVLSVHEARMDRVAVGQAALVSVEGIGDRRFTGKITKIAVLADSQNRWLNPDLKEYETEVLLDDTDIALKPGVTARVEILVDSLKDVLAVPVQSVYSKGISSYVFVGGGRNATPVPVVVGLAGVEYVEVKSGLDVGQQVLLAISDELRRSLPEMPMGPDVRPPQQSQNPVAGEGKKRGPGRHAQGTSQKRASKVNES